VQPVCPHVGAPVGGLRNHEGPAVRSHGESGRPAAGVCGAAGERVAKEAARRAAELEHSASVSVGHQDVARPTVDRHAVRALELTLTERVACITNGTY